MKSIASERSVNRVESWVSPLLELRGTATPLGSVTSAFAPRADSSTHAIPKSNAHDARRGLRRLRLRPTPNRHQTHEHYARGLGAREAVKRVESDFRDRPIYGAAQLEPEGTFT